MKSWLIEKYGLENLQLVEQAVPVPGPKQIVIHNRAASLNYRDWDLLSGHYLGPHTLPLVPASDVAGEVVRVGSEVSDFIAGDRVTGLFRQHWLDGEPDEKAFASSLGGPLQGVLSEYVLLEEKGAPVRPNGSGNRGSLIGHGFRPLERAQRLTDRLQRGYTTRCERSL